MQKNTCRGSCLQRFLLNWLLWGNCEWFMILGTTSVPEGTSLVQRDIRFIKKHHGQFLNRCQIGIEPFFYKLRTKLFLPNHFWVEGEMMLSVLNRQPIMKMRTTFSNKMSLSKAGFWIADVGHLKRVHMQESKIIFYHNCSLSNNMKVGSIEVIQVCFMWLKSGDSCTVISSRYDFLDRFRVRVRVWTQMMFQLKMQTFLPYIWTSIIGTDERTFDHSKATFYCHCQELLVRYECVSRFNHSLIFWFQSNEPLFGMRGLVKNKYPIWR